MKVLRKVFLIGICSVLILSAIATAVFLVMTKDSALNRDKLILSENNIMLYDVDNHEIAEISARKANKNVSVSEIPQHLI